MSSTRSNMFTLNCLLKKSDICIITPPPQKNGISIKQSIRVDIP